MVLQTFFFIEKRKAACCGQNNEKRTGNFGRAKFSSCSPSIARKPGSDCQVCKGRAGYLVMADQKNIPVSRSQKDKLTERFGWL